MEQRGHLIKEVQAGSIAQEMDVRPGDLLMEVNGSPVADIIEYKYLINEEYIEVLIQKASGEQWLLEIDKEFHEDPGFVFETGLMDQGKRCKNKCLFCFIDQLPKGMRDSLYFKDDDARMSFLQGNFITLTNLETKDIDRIIKYRISPLNISVHTTDPGLRVKMLGNPKAGQALALIGLFLEHGLTLNCQIVLCPGINDRRHLDKSLKDLGDMGRGINSIGVVPVGITKYRKGLFSLKPFDREDAAAAVNTVVKWQKYLLQRYGCRIVYAADELYQKAGIPIPAAGDYDGFPQLENGIGMTALFGQQFNSELEATDWEQQIPGEMSVATGLAAYEFISRLVRKTEELSGQITVHVYPITNNFFGETIDVAGLITGRDLLKQLEGKDLGDRLLIPRCMLKAEEELFLDGVSVSRIQECLKTKVEVCEVNGRELLRKIVQGEKL